MSLLEFTPTCKTTENVVWLRGEHDVATVAAVSDAIARAIAKDRSDLIVDLSGVEFMGVATVHLIDRAANFLQSRSRSFSVRDPSPSARLVLGLCGMLGLVAPTAVTLTLVASP